MGFTNVVWESRSTTQLARDLTDGPGPTSVGQAGAAWVRVADEFAAISTDYARMVERLQGVWQSRASAASVRALDHCGQWLQQMALAAASNGEHAEQAAVANTEAVLAMPSVSEAVAAQDTHDMMASLAAYNGAILNGRFAEFDEATRSDHADAATVMRQYEDAVTALAQPWEQPTLDAGNAHDAQSDQAKAGHTPGGAGSGAGAVSVPPVPLSAWTAPTVEASADRKSVQRSNFHDAPLAAGGAGAGGYAPMAPYGRGEDSRDYESTRPAGLLDGGGERAAGLVDVGPSWVPATHHDDSAFTVSAVSWGPNSALFDELVAPEAPQPEGFADAPERTLEQVSDRWVSPPVIGNEQGRR